MLLSEIQAKQYLNRDKIFDANGEIFINNLNDLNALNDWNSFSVSVDT